MCLFGVVGWRAGLGFWYYGCDFWVDWRWFCDLVVDFGGLQVVVLWLMVGFEC